MNSREIRDTIAAIAPNEASASIAVPASQPLSAFRYDSELFKGFMRCFVQFDSPSWVTHRSIGQGNRWNQIANSEFCEIESERRFLFAATRTGLYRKNRRGVVGGGLAVGFDCGR